MATAAVLRATPLDSKHIQCASSVAPRDQTEIRTMFRVTSRCQTNTATRGRLAHRSDFQLLHSLPTELLELTFAYLGVGDLLRLKRVDHAVSDVVPVRAPVRQC